MNKLYAIVGMSGTGKSVVTDYLESIGYKKVYFGGVTMEKLQESNLEVNPENEKYMREKLRREHGPECYAKFLDPEIKEELKKGNVVLDGLYSWYEYKYLIERYPNLKLICVVTDKNKRYERVAVRPDRPFKREDIIYRDISEIENLYKGGPIAFADYYILNNGSIDEELKRLKEILEEDD